MPFISFCCLIAEARTSSTTLNSSGDSGCSCHVPDLRGNILFFPIENDIHCGFFIDGFYDIEVCTLYPYTLKCFNPERMLYFAKCFFCIHWEDHMVLVFSFINVLYHVDLWMLNHPGIPGMNPTWSWWIILLMYCWILLVSILVRIFASMFFRDIGL